MVPQPGTIEKIAFARFDGHRYSTVNIAVESRQCAGALRVGRTMVGDGLLQLVARGEGLVDGRVQRVEI